MRKLRSKRMHILVLSWRDWKDPLEGGTERSTRLFMQYFRKKGHKVTLFCRRYPGSNKEDFWEGIRILRAGNQFTVYLHAAWQYITKLHKEIDVIVDQVNGVPWYTPSYAPSKPKVVILHHMVRKLFFKELPYPFSYVAFFGEKVMPYLYKKEPIITVSESSKQDILNFGFKNKNIYVNYNGIDSGHVPGEKSRTPLLFFVGRLKKYKNIEMQIRAVQKLKAEFPNIKLVLAGKGDHEEALKELVKKEKLEKWVEFAGFITHTQKVRYYQQAWAFLMSSYKEGWGITCLEANACGTPVVASDVPGLRDSVKHNKTGLLYDIEDLDDMVEKLRLILKNKKLREKLSRFGIKYAKNFTWDKYSDTIYQKILAVTKEFNSSS